jgi:hypothetical protein
VALHPDLDSLTVNQFDGRNLLWRSVIRYGTSKIWYWPLLMTLAVTRLQILDDVSNLIQTRMSDRLRLTCPFRKLYPHVAMVQSRHNRNGCNGTVSLDPSTQPKIRDVTFGRSR